MRTDVNDQYFTFTDGQLFFTYYPASGIVKPNNHPSAYRSIEHFSRRGFEIDWLKTNIQRLHIVVCLPEVLTKEEQEAIVCTTRDDLHKAYEEDTKTKRDNTIANNLNNITGKPIAEESLKVMLSRISTSKKGRQEVADWFNTYNIEDIRPDHPIVIISTKNKNYLVKEGKRLIWALFEQGKLRKLTPEQVVAKMEKYS